MSRQQEIKQFLQYLKETYAPKEALQQQTTEFFTSLENEEEFPDKEFIFIQKMVEFAYQRDNGEQKFFEEASQLEKLLQNEKKPEKQNQYRQQLDELTERLNLYREETFAIVDAFEERKKKKWVH